MLGKESKLPIKENYVKMELYVSQNAKMNYTTELYFQTYRLADKSSHHEKMDPSYILELVKKGWKQRPQMSLSQTFNVEYLNSSYVSAFS